MQLKTRILMPFLGAALMIGISSSAFAQLSCGVASTPVSRDTVTGLTEVAGDLTLNCAAPAGATPTTAATITVSYGGYSITDAPFTITPASLGYPTAKPINIVNTTGGFSGAGAPTIAGINNTTGQITISVPAQAAPTTSSFTLTGVLLALTGSAVGSSVNANVSVSPGNNLLITAGQNVATVITSIQNGINDPKLTKGNPVGLALTSGVVPTAGFSVDITEGYQDMFRTIAQFDAPGATNDTEILLTFAGIPSGWTIGGCTVSDSVPVGSSGTAYPTMTISSNTITSAAPTVLIDFAGVGAVDLVDIDTVKFACTTFSGSSTAPALTAGSVTVTASLAPTGSALGSGGVVLTTAATNGQIPRYTALQQPATPLTVILINPATTTMLIPFAEVVGAYDTGIALANTTTDPFGAKTGGAIQTAGPVTFSIYPQYVNGASTQQTACTLTTGSGATAPTYSLTSIPGQGLDSAGQLRTGSTWTVNLSNILTAAPAAAGCPSATNFIGYVFIVANSVEVHGTAFVYNNGNFTSYTNVLVLPPPSAAASRGALAAEILGN